MDKLEVATGVAWQWYLKLKEFLVIRNECLSREEGYRYAKRYYCGMELPGRGYLMRWTPKLDKGWHRITFKEFLEAYNLEAYGD